MVENSLRLSDEFFINHYQKETILNEFVSKIIKNLHN